MSSLISADWALAIVAILGMAGTVVATLFAWSSKSVRLSDQMESLKADLEGFRDDVEKKFDGASREIRELRSWIVGRGRRPPNDDEG